MRFRPRLDSTQKEIVEALRATGCTVVSLAGCGGGVPDLLVGVAGRTVLIEAKSPRKIRKRATQLDETQVRWIERWRGGPVYQVTSVDEALRAVNP